MALMSKSLSCRSEFNSSCQYSNTCKAAYAGCQDLVSTSSTQQRYAIDYCYCHVCGFGQHAPSLPGAESKFTSKYSLAKQMALIALPTASTPMAVKHTSAPSLTLAASAPATLEGSVALATGISIFCKDSRQFVQLLGCTGQDAYTRNLIQQKLWWIHKKKSAGKVQQVTG